MLISAVGDYITVTSELEKQVAVIMLHPHSSAPVLDVDFYGEKSVADPIPAYHEMLELGSVVWLSQNNMHAICGYTAPSSVCTRTE